MMQNQSMYNKILGNVSKLKYLERELTNRRINYIRMYKTTILPVLRGWKT